MSSSKKVDLLVRVRYSNPLPPPPCPPKLLLLETDLARFGSYQDTASIARGQPLPMMVDSECGMGIDLLDWREAWEGDFKQMNPTHEVPTLHPADAELLAPPRPDLPPPGLASTSKLAAGASGTITPSAGAGPASREPANNWLLNAKGTAGELRASQRSDLGVDNLRAAGKAKARLPPTQRKRPEVVDRSLEAQNALIERTFDDLANTDIDKLKFPGKPHLTVVETFDVLPDAESWANGYSLLRFQEPPGGETTSSAVDGRPDPHISSSLFRPTVTNDGDNVMVYYLPENVEQSEQAVSAMHPRPDQEPDYVPEPIPYRLLRKYEIIGQGRQGTELAFVFREGEEALQEEGEGSGAGKKRKHGVAGYHEFHSRATMRKRRAVKNQHGEEDHEGVPQWDIINFQLEPATGDMAIEREDGRAAVDDPTWLSRMAQAQAQAAREAGGDEADEVPVPGQEGAATQDAVEDQEMEDGSASPAKDDA